MMEVSFIVGYIRIYVPQIRAFSVNKMEVCRMNSVFFHSIVIGFTGNINHCDDDRNYFVPNSYGSILLPLSMEKMKIMNVMRKRRSGTHSL